MDIARERVMRLADLQWGRVSSGQLQDLGVSTARITRWVRTGYLRKVLPRVYAVGHLAESVEADLVAAVLYAGPLAMLSHATALWWHGIFEHRPTFTQVSTPHKRGSRLGVTVYERRNVDLIHHRRLPTTTVSQALFDFASTAPVDRVVHALAEADYRRLLNPLELNALRGPGRATIKEALQRHTPELAKTKSELERAFRRLCQRGQIPPYEINQRVCGIKVDAFWPELKVIVELDGVQGHATPAQMARDHGRDLKLRAAGYIVLRYSCAQVIHQAEAVLADLRTALASAARCAATAP
jgi:very-short-patch-repair endonuclease